MSGGISIPFAVVALVLQGVERRTFACMAFVTLGYFAFSLLRRIRALETPLVDISCGEGIPDSITRNGDVEHHYIDSRTGKHAGTFLSRADFFGFIITNPGREPVIKCQANLIKLEKGGVVLWDKVTALSFGPRSKQEVEPLEEVEIRNGVPRPAAVVSVSDKNDVMHGSLNQCWKYHVPFHSFFKEPGDYVFTIAVSSANTAVTKVFKAVFVWSGKRETSTIRPL